MGEVSDLSDLFIGRKYLTADQRKMKKTRMQLLVWLKVFSRLLISSFSLDQGGEKIATLSQFSDFLQTNQEE